jgi:hypothetical protein
MSYFPWLELVKFLEVQRFPFDFHQVQLWKLNLAPQTKNEF